MPDAASPRPAAVVVLHRRRADGELEVFWVRRADNLSFLGGFWAFVGGGVDAIDHATQVSGAPDSEAAARIAAASRELHEETGVTIAPDAARFVPAGRSITPGWAPVRFDATYYLVACPPDAQPDVAHAGGELSTGAWIRPADAVAAWTRAERLTSPIVLGMMSALVPGLDGAPDRLAAHTEAEARASRLWDLVPALGMCMLRTPTLLPATHTNCFVVGGRELVVIDPGSPYPEERAALDEALDAHAAAGRRVREILLTHHHNDHIGGAAHLAARLGVPIAAHALTAERVASRGVTVTRTLTDGDVITLPGDDAFPERRLRAVFTPGHTPGHLCYLEEHSGFLIAGDMVAGIGTIIVDPSEGDMRDYLASLRLMKMLAPRALLPAHGPIMTTPDAKLDEYVQHRLWREEKVAAALAARGEASAAELVPAVYSDVDPSVFGLATRSLAAHLIKLVKDGRARALDGDRYGAV